MKIYHLYGRIINKNYCLKLSLEYPITAQAIRFPAFPVFKLSAFPPCPQSSSSNIYKIAHQAIYGLERPSYLCRTSNQAVLTNCYKQNIHKVWKDLNFEPLFYAGFCPILNVRRCSSSLYFTCLGEETRKSKIIVVKV